jgi:DNA-binding CsgD family transcriptional regulator
MAMGALSPRERELLLLSARGLSVAEIADMLGLAENTVKVEKSLMRRRLGARNSAQAVVLGVMNGDVTLDEIQSTHRSPVAATGAPQSAFDT